MTRAEKKHVDRVAAQPCAICDAHGVHVHHIREGQGMAQRASNWLTIPLCPDCHLGPRGVHGDKSVLRARKVGELDLLAQTLERIYA